MSESIYKDVCVDGVNVLLCRQNGDAPPQRVVVFFGGDVQAKQGVMTEWHEYSLDRMCLAATKSLGIADVFVCVLPSRYHMNVFSCYDDFVKSDGMGTATYGTCSSAVPKLKARPVYTTRFFF